MTNTPKNQFLLDVRIEKLPPMKIEVLDTITVGLDPRNDLVLTGPKIKNRHMIFSQKGENLALHYLGHTNQAFLNSLPIEEDKSYLLEPGDILQFSSVEIIIRHELVHVSKLHETAKKVVFNSLDDLQPESLQESLIYADNPTGSMKRQPHVNEPFLKEVEHAKPEELTEPGKFGRLLSLWVIKLYALLTDSFITYFVLVTLLPLLFVDTYALKFLELLNSYVFPERSHSFFKFFIAWYLLSFIQTMIFGSTVGQFLLGLRNKNETTFGKLILFRLKTLLFSLVMLPAQNTVSDKLFFKGIRRAGIIVILFFILLAPLLLPFPYNKLLTVIEASKDISQNLHTKTIASYSADMQMDLRAELPLRYLLLPYVFKNSALRSFQFIDLKSGKEIVIYEKDKLTYDHIEEQLEYANPLYSVIHKTPLKNLPLKYKKIIVERAVILSPLNIINVIQEFGPFYGSAILLKERFLDDSDTNDTLVKLYAPETPIMFIGSAQQDFFYLFTPQGISRFVVDSIKRGSLVSVFEDEIFTKLLAESTGPLDVNNQQVEILKAQDDFIHGNEQTLLTYYVGVANNLSNAKIIHEEVDLTEKAKAAVVRNIETVQKFIKNQNLYRSFDDIKTQLTPMEKPGEER